MPFYCKKCGKCKTNKEADDNLKIKNWTGWTHDIYCLKRSEIVCRMQERIKMLELFKFIFAICAGTCFAVVLFVVGMFGFWCIGNQVVYYFDKSICTATVNEEMVYSGRCHFITVTSVGENGNSKHLTIYKDAMKIKPLNHYIAENIKVSEK